MRHRRVKASSVIIPIASMGDIAFLLIIFFVVCSNFAKEAGVRVTPPKSADIAELEQAGLSVAIDQEGLIYLQGTNVPGAEAVEWGLTALLQGRTTAKERTVFFRCDASVDREQFLPVLIAISKAGGIVAAVADKPPRTNLSQP